MYSYEIDQILKSQNYIINSVLYLQICNTSPQITRIKYEAFQDSFTIWTDDGWCWNFKVIKQGEK